VGPEFEGQKGKSRGLLQGAITAFGGRNSSVGIMIRLRDPRFQSRQGKLIFRATTTFRPALGPTQPTIFIIIFFI
jgi:hypothetical protein